jgi:hypothetical protein
VVVFSDGQDVLAATPSTSTGREATAWTSQPVEPGALGAGVSATTSSDGTVFAAYYEGTEIHVASSKDGTAWSVSSAGTSDAPPAGDAGGSTGVAVDGNGTVFVTWYDPTPRGVVLVSGDGQTFTPIQTEGTAGGSQPSLAAAQDGTIFVAWYHRANGDLMLGAYGETSGLAVAVRSPTPTGPPSPPAPPPSQACEKVRNGEITVVAQGIAFLTICIETPAGEPFTIHFDNKDAGVQHNVQIFDSTDASGDLLMQGEIITGPDTIDYQVDPLDAGEYFFNCVVHPTQMTGKVVAKG